MNTFQASVTVQLEYSFHLLEDSRSSTYNFHSKRNENKYASTISANKGRKS